MRKIQLICTCILIYGIAVTAYSQKTYKLRFQLSDLDIENETACYDVELSNGGNEEWFLANYNIAVFYDASVACLISDSLLLDDIVYDPARTDVVTSAMGTPLSYESTLGFIRFSISANMLGVLMDTMGTWVPTIRLCYNLKVDSTTSITSPDFCFQSDVNSEQLRSILGVPRNIVQEGDPNNLPSDVLEDSMSNSTITPDRRLNSCFTIEENTQELCTDGIDNDEDGLIDCMDLDGCSPGSANEIFFNVNQPTCEDSLGFIRANGASLGSMFSADNGLTFQSDSVVMGLTAGGYDFVIRKNGISACEFSSPILLIEPECRETDDMTCTDGIDNDGDGLIDCSDMDCLPTIGVLLSTEPNNCPDLNNGSITISSGSPDVEYSIDGGMSYQESSIFANLENGSYPIFIRNATTLCEVPWENISVTLANDTICIAPVEVCSDGIDNDSDGLIDCQDDNCANDQNCIVIVESSFYIPSAFSIGNSGNSRFGVEVEDDGQFIIRTFNIFDRYGSLVFQSANTDSRDQSHFWDGRINGNRAAQGVYVYQLDYILNGSEESTSGHVTLVY